VFRPQRRLEDILPLAFRSHSFRYAAIPVLCGASLINARNARRRSYGTLYPTVDEIVRMGNGWGNGRSKRLAALAEDKRKAPSSMDQTGLCISNGGINIALVLYHKHGTHDLRNLRASPFPQSPMFPLRNNN